MARERSRTRWTVRLCLVLTGFLLCVPAPADEPPQTSLERMERELLRLRVQIQNAKMRLELGLVGAIGDDDSVAGPVTPARACCSINIEKMKGAVGALSVVFDELERCHRAADHHAAVSTLGFARKDLQEVARATQALAIAQTQPEALGALGGATRVYLGLLETSEGIEDCVAQAGVPSEDEDGASVQGQDKRKKSKKKKQKQTEDGSEE